MAVKPGDVLAGKYVIHELVGAGGMGSVFLADQPALARSVAIKILHPHLATNRYVAQRFREEAVAASRVRHPRSVSVIDVAQLVDGTPYIVFEHVRGRSLGRLIAEEEIPVPRALAIVDQILSAVDAAHASGVVHADVKSDNFLVDESGGRDRVTMIDFGLARVEDQRPLAIDDQGQRVVSGTPEYMAPEVIRGEPPVRASDLYAVGVILYELLTGTTPFSGGSTKDVMRRHLEDLVVPCSLRRPDREIPEALDRVVLRALAKTVEERFSDARDFAAALRGSLPVYRTKTTGRIPRVTIDTETPTRNFAEPIPGTRIDKLRKGIGDAIMRGDRAQIASGYKRLADVLAAEDKVASAMCELQEGIDLLTGGADHAAVDDAVDQLVVAIGTLYAEARGHDHGGYPTLTDASFG